MLRWTKRSTGSSRESSSTKGTYAAPDHDCWCKNQWHDDVVDRLKRRIGSLRLGDPLDKNTDIGAINSEAQLKRITDLVGTGEAEGALRWTNPCDLPAEGKWFAPTIFTGVGQSMRIAQEEIFGPVLSVLTFQHPRRGGGQGQQHPLRTVSRNLDKKGQPHAEGGSPATRRGGLGQHLQRVRPGLTFWRVPGIRMGPRGRSPRPSRLPCLIVCITSRRPYTNVEDNNMTRLDIHKTYKLSIGGAFPRSESGRSYRVMDAKGRFLANAAMASRKDARDAVAAARKAFSGWSGTTAPATAVVDATIDRWVWWAGWTDKFPQIHATANPVAGPFFNVSSPEPTGVVAVIAPQRTSALGLVEVLGSVIASGNTAVVVASTERPLAAVTMTEVLMTPDMPDGVVNLLTGSMRELAPVLAAHRDIDALDLRGLTDEPDAQTLIAELCATAAEDLKRVVRSETKIPDWTSAGGPEGLLAFTELKTVWHPEGL